MTTGDSCQRVKAARLGLRHLRGLTAPQSLGLSFTSLKGNGLQFLSSLTALQKLALVHCRNLTDRALQHLSNLTALTELGLQGSESLTDEGLRHLEGLAALQHFNLTLCNSLTQQGEQRLRDAIPALRAGRWSWWGVPRHHLQNAPIINRALRLQEAISRLETPKTTNYAHKRGYKAPVHQPGKLA